MAHPLKEVLHLCGEVEGLRAAGDEWTDVAVVVSDPDLNYLRSEAALVDQRVAAREWELIRTAMTKRSSFEQVSSFAPAVAQTRTANAIGAIILAWRVKGILDMMVAAHQATDVNIRLLMDILAGQQQVVPLIVGCRLG